jgi:hypothetical protein
MSVRLVRCLALGFALGAPGLALAQSETPPPTAPDSSAARPAHATATAGTRGPSPWYFGGSVGLGFYGDVTSVSVAPMFGYKLSPKASLGGRIGYEYYKDRGYDPDLTSDNFGGGVFTRYRLIPQAYLHAEFEYWSYDFGPGRYWVPYLLLGGGYSQPLSKNSQLMVEVLFDVLQDPQSPYDAWEPQVNVGIGVGF